MGSRIRRHLTFANVMSCIAVCVALLVVPAESVAAPGDHDTGWGGTGVVTTDISGQFEKAYTSTIQLDGKVVLAGANGAGQRWAVVRYLDNGALDSSFGAGGKLTIAFDAASGPGAAQSVIQQPDGKLILVGNFYDGTTYDGALARLSPDGTYDTTFSGDGRILIAGPEGSLDLRAAALQSNGKIVVAGYTYADAGDGNNDDAILFRMNADGTVDNTFPTVTFVGSAGYGQYFQALAVDGNDNIIALGDTYDNGPLGLSRKFFLKRLAPGGSHDPTFGTNGTAILDLGDGATATALAIDSAGRYLLAGHVTGSGVVARIHPAGGLDSSFDGDGAIYDPAGSDVHGIVAESSGNIVVAGPENIVRLTSSGAPDTTFGPAGSRAYLSMYEPGNLLLDTQGRYVATGWARYDQDGFQLPGFDDFAAERFVGGAPPDVCSNLSGNQASVPVGMIQLGTTCNGSSAGTTMSGTSGADTINAGGGNDTVYGGGGNDSIVGGAGADKLYGGAGADRVDGGDGADTIVGNAGKDTLIGRAGNDVINARDGARGDVVNCGAGSRDLARINKGDKTFGCERVRYS